MTEEMSKGGNSSGCRSPPTGKQHKQEERQEDPRLLTTCESSSPYYNLLLVAKYAGLCFNVPTRKRCGIYVSWTMVYHGIILLVSWFTVLNYFTAYQDGEVFGPMLVSKLMHHVFFLKASLCVTSCTLLSLKRKRLWKTYDQHNETYGFDLRHNPSVKRRVHVSLVLCCVSFLTVLAFYVFQAVAKTDTFLYRLNYQSVQGSTAKFILLCITCVQAVLSGIAWFVPISLLVLLCLDIRDAFRKLTADLQNEIRMNGDTTLDLEQFRQRHQGLCGIVEQTDAIYTVVILSVYLTSIPMACLLIYVLIMTSGVESQSIATAECLLFVAWCLIEMVTVTAAATALNTAVKVKVALEGGQERMKGKESNNIISM